MGQALGQPDDRENRTQGHRAESLPTAVPAFGTQGPGENVLWGTLPGNGLGGGHILSVQKLSYTLGALPPAALPRWVLWSLMERKTFPMAGQSPPFFRARSLLPSRLLPTTVHSALPRP